MDIDLLIEHDVRIRSVSCFEPSTKSRRLIENQKRSAKSVFSFIQQGTYIYLKMCHNFVARYKYALEKRDCFSISKLLNKYDSNIQIENVNKYGENSLILAACEGYDAVVAKVLKYNTLNVNLKDNDGLTALMWCSKLGYTDTVSLLLASEGIDINICSTLNRNSALIFACMYGHTSVVSKLLNSPDINVNLKNKYGKTALMWASSEGHCDLVRMLLSRDDILVNLADIEGRTALMMASVQHHSNVVATLLESGLVDVNLQSVDKGTALIYATRLGFSDIVSQLLLVSSINVNLQNSYGNTALHSAVVRENVELTSLLLTHPEINSI